jgi:hypothetical protein
VTAALIITTDVTMSSAERHAILRRPGPSPWCMTRLLSAAARNAESTIFSNMRASTVLRPSALV